MRGRRETQATLLVFVDLEERVAKNHPLRTIKAVADKRWSVCRQSIDRMYLKVGQASEPPERLLKA